MIPPGDAAGVPLIRGDGRGGDDQDADDGEEYHRLDGLTTPIATTAGPQQEGKARSPGMWMWVLAFSAGISGLLFGYDTGVISATLVSIGDALSGRQLSTRDKSLITACTSFFALLASPVAGWAADRLGRRKVLLAADGLFMAGAVWQAFARTVPSMVAGRSVVGVAVGVASLVVPLYISELAPAAYRGRLVVIQILMITLGQAIAYGVGWGLSVLDGGWRWMVGLGAVPAGVQGIMLVAWLPESPRWLVKVGKVAEARKVLGKVFGGDDVVEGVVRGVELEIAGEEGEKAGWWELWSNSGNRRALFIACFLQGFQQLCGFNSLMYFSATIFALLSFPSPTLPALAIACTNFLFTILAFLLIDRIGRRRTLLYTVPIMALALGVCAWAFGHLDIMKVHVDGTGVLWPAYLILATLTVYVAGYATGLGPIPWFQSELFPLSVRALGSSLSTATNWSANFIVGISFLPALEILGARATFIVYAVICILGWVGIWWVFPEMGGVGLEGVKCVLEGTLRKKRSSGRGDEQEL